MAPPGLTFGEHCVFLYYFLRIPNLRELKHLRQIKHNAHEKCGLGDNGLLIA